MEFVEGVAAGRGRAPLCTRLAAALLAASRDRFKALSADDRQKVIDMVVSR